MAHHRRGLRRLLRDDALFDRIEAALAADVKADGELPHLAVVVDARRLALLRYASRLTLQPASITSADVDALRAAGLDDTDVLHLAEVVAYYAYVNRIADGLGVALEQSGD